MHVRTTKDVWVVEGKPSLMLQWGEYGAEPIHDSLESATAYMEEMIGRDDFTELRITARRVPIDVKPEEE